MSEKISILYTIPNFITAGSGKALLNIARRLDRKKFEPSVCVLRKGGELEREFESSGIPVLKAPFCVPVKPYLSLLGRAAKAADFFRPLRFDIWHSFHYLDDYTEPLIARFSGARAWVYTKKNMNWGGNGWHARTFLAKGVVAQNREMAEQFFRNNTKVSLIPRGIETALFSDASADDALARGWNFPKDSVIAAHVGHLVPVKNHEFLLKALALSNPKICMVFAGEFMDADYSRKIKDTAAQMNLGQRVRFTGKTKDVPGLLKACDFFIFSSHRESSPVACLEAMASGLASVVTEIPAMRDIHIQNETALSVPSGDAAAFAKAMDTLAGDENLRRRMGKSAQERASAFFSIEREVRDHENFYERTLRG